MAIEIISLILLCVVCVALIVNVAEDYSHNRSFMSFQESMDLVNLPVITFYNGNTKLNFLLDTGSTLNIINSSVLDTIEHSQIDGEGDAFGVDGNTINVSFISMNFSYKNKQYSSTFQVINMQYAFGRIKEEYGVQIHGILGNEFFKEHKYILDFNTLKAYYKA